MLLLVAATVTLGLVTPVAPASATENPRTIVSSSWAHTDSQAANTSFVDPAGDAPVGSWRDGEGKHHKAKSYFTFDLRPLHGARIIRASLWGAETAANDCAKPRSTEVWLSEPADQPTWADQPAELVRLPGPGASGCLWPHTAWTASEPLAQAVAAGQDSITFAMRIAEAVQGDVAYGRRYSPDLKITIVYNFPPNTPTDLRVGQEWYRPHRCADEAQPIVLGTDGPQVTAAISDPDGTYGLGGSVALWPVDHPEQRVQLDSDNARYELQVTFPAGTISEGGTYAVAARAADGHDVSAWTEPCLITADLTRPAAAPTVSSTVYPENGSGGGPNVPGELVFDPNGVEDVAGYYWGEFGTYHYVAAEQIGGPGRVTFTPTRSGPTYLQVRSVDRAGNSSDTRTYNFWVDSNGPRVSSPTGETAELGVAKQFHLAPGMDGVVEYVHRIDEGPETTVPAGPDGTATVSIVPTEAYLHSFTAYSRTADGTESEVGGLDFTVQPAEPVVTFSVEEGRLGVPLQATFSTDRDDVASYTYRLNSDSPVTVVAEADGRATVTLTPTRAGGNYLEVSSTTRDGYHPGRVRQFLYVDPAEPVVTSPQYPEQGTGGGVGVPGEFTFTTSLVDVAEYVYRFDSGEQVVVPAGPDGSATVTFTPNRSGWFSLTVRARTATGITSAQNYYPFTVAATTG